MRIGVGKRDSTQSVSSGSSTTTTTTITTANQHQQPASSVLPHCSTRQPLACLHSHTTPSTPWKKDPGQTWQGEALKLSAAHNAWPPTVAAKSNRRRSSGPGPRGRLARRRYPQDVMDGRRHHRYTETRMYIALTQGNKDGTTTRTLDRTAAQLTVP